jgi:hypothetical protein
MITDCRFSPQASQFDEGFIPSLLLATSHVAGECYEHQDQQSTTPAYVWPDP